MTTTRLPPIAPKRLYQQISELLRQSIDDGTFAVGSFLPPERELAEQLRVSRTSVREALIALEVEGRVSVRVGAGVQVLAPAARATRVAAASDAPIGPLDLLDARLVIEPETAALAAENARGPDVVRLQEWCAQMARDYRKGSRTHDADRAFHLDLARIGGNAALELLVTQLWALRQNVLQARFEAIFSTQQGYEATERDHADILAAVQARDAGAARDAMRRHLMRVRDRLVRAIDGT
ncbi:MAG: FadR family transcriptional regulator [Rhodoferax sp.]|nr:FadR family transcriptional regulator [Rhodoferax sp.]